jgi:putative heme-binding domain-containing protein
MMPFYGAHFGWNHPWSSDWTGENHLPTVPVSHEVFHGSGTGIVFGSLGEHRGVFFINDWLNKTTFIFKPKWDGALMKCEGDKWVPFISGGNALFRPTDIMFGPDGALWCMSWSRGYGAEYDKAGKMTSEGRVYRITADKATKPSISFKPMKERTAKELLEAFNSPLPVHRIDAQDEFVRRGKPRQNELGRELERDDLTQAQQTWGIGALGRIAPIMVINDGVLSEDNVNIQTLRSSMRNPKSITVPDVLRLAATEDSARMRFEVVQAVWQTHNVELVPLLMGIASKETDRLTFYCAWRALRDLASTELLKRMLKDSHAGVRRAALLALLEDSALNRDEVAALTSDTDVETAKLAKLWLANTSGDAQEILVKGNGITKANVAPIKGTPPVIKPPSTPTTLDAALAAMKDAKAERGRLLALHPQGAGCIACHYIGGRGNHFGPDLTGIGDRAEVKHLLQSMIEPSAVITEGFNSHVITTKQGTQMGVLLDESGIAVTLGLATGQRVRIMRADITKQDTLPISAMPPFNMTLTPEQCADIAAWLMTQKANSKTAKQKK